MLIEACKAYDSSLIDTPPHSDISGVSSCDPVAGGLSEEKCNATDDDCDGIIDEGAATDCRMNHAAAQCVIGFCVFARCDEGFVDCNQDYRDGCEQPIQGCRDCSRKRCTNSPGADPRDYEDAGLDDDAGLGPGDDLDGGLASGARIRPESATMCQIGSIPRCAVSFSASTRRLPSG